MGVAQAISFMSLIWARPADTSSTIRLRLGDSQSDVDGGSAQYDSGALPLITPAITREDGNYSSHLELPSIQTRRWWRIDVTQATGDFEASMLVLGKKLTPANYYSPGWIYGIEDLGDITISPNGVADETPGRIMRSLEFEFGWMAEADYEAQWRPLIEKLGKRRVACWCFDPTATAYRQAKTYMGWIKTPPGATAGEVAGKVKIPLVIRSMI